MQYRIDIKPKHGVPTMHTQSKRTPKQWIKVMGRLSDPKRRAQIAKNFQRDHGKPMSDPDGFNMYVAFPTDHYGFKGAFAAAKEYIANEKSVHLDAFEWRIDGGEW